MGTNGFGLTVTKPLSSRTLFPTFQTEEPGPNSFGLTRVDIHVGKTEPLVSLTVWGEEVASPFRGVEGHGPGRGTTYGHVSVPGGESSRVRMRLRDTNDTTLRITKNLYLGYKSKT